MIFLAIHTHLPEKCIIDNPQKIKKFRASLSEEEAIKNGCRILSVYVSPTEHIAYIIFETNKHENMLSFLKPLIKLGITEIKPVDEWRKVSNGL